MANLLLNIFGSSPIAPLQKHMQLANQCANKLPEFFNSVVEDNWDQATSIQSEINDLEHQADEMKQEIRSHLPKHLLMPVPRIDLLNLLLEQDKIANTTKDISGLVLGRKMQIPASIRNEFLAFINKCVETVEQATVCIKELDELFEVGFRGPEVDLVGKQIDMLDQLESDTDDMQSHLRSLLFKIEKELHAVDVMFLYKLIETAGDLADTAERVGRRLQMLLAK
ncbi:MAG: TIGR00153 family protein [Gammaproteobacteria bacterium]|nr:TIGR00153 family protein [Gammaproteobacteria bacterium]